LLLLLASEPVVAAEPASFRDCDTCPVMIVVPAGSFVMGAPTGLENEIPWERQVDGARLMWESPEVPVTFRSSFALGKFEITRDQFAAFVRETGFVTKPGCVVWAGGFNRTPDKSWSDPGIAQTGDHPVACIDRTEAEAYAAWLSRKTGRRYYIPAEAQLEYASRAGARTLYPWGDKVEDVCRYANVADATLAAKHTGRAAVSCTDGHLYTAPVGSFAANPWGFHDLTGNVWEWGADCWYPSHIHKTQDGGPAAKGYCEEAPLRGGAYGTGPMFLRSSSRGGPDEISGTHQSWIGFRLAADVR
jgi:formylglycine-generating enzyme required for sulfatase activity